VRTVFLLVLLALLPQEPSQLPKEPIRDFKFVLKDVRIDPTTKLDVEEITLVLKGKEAVPRTPIKVDKEVFDLKGVDAHYYTTPTPKEPSHEIKVKSDRGVLDKGARTLKLDDNVSIIRKGLQDRAHPERTERDTVLLTPSALLRFNLMYECPTCRKIYGAAGHCPDHGVPLRETTITSVETDREFDLAGPEGVLSGSGLVTDDAIRRDYHIARDGFVEFSGDLNPSEDRKVSVPPQARFTQIFSRGPLAITGPMDARTIHGEGGARVDRIDSGESLTLLCETLTVDTVRRWDLSAAGSVECPKLDAKGDVVVDGISFADGESFHATADTLLRTVTEEQVPDGTLVHDVTVMTARAPQVVSLTRGQSRIDSRKVTIRRATEKEPGLSVFENVVRSDLLQDGQHFNLACDLLKVHAEANDLGKTEIRTLDATGHVVLGGLMAAKTAAPSPSGPDDPGEARADHFFWDLSIKRGLLEASKENPFVRITQGASTIQAPKVLLESQEIMVLKGPKSVRLVQDNAGKQEEYRATCEGDMVIDNSPERHQLTMRDHCVLRTEEMLLNSDRINGDLDPGGKGLRSLLALGHVRAIHQEKKEDRDDESTGPLPPDETPRDANQTTLHGDRLYYRFSDQSLRVYGNPRTVADTGHTLSTQGEIRVYDQKHPKTGEMVRYTEMIGDSDGVHIEIDERAEKPDDKKRDEKKK
jgi:hypothetical protein